MKALLAILGVLITVGVVVVCAVVELLIKLMPLLGLAAWIWIGIKVWRRWRERREDRDHIDTPWEWEHPARRPVPLGEDPRPAPPAAVPVAPAPALPIAGPGGLLPPVIAHQDRSFVVRGHDSGLLSDREDGYLYVSAQDLPRVPRVAASRRPNVAARRTSGRREVRRRP